MSTASSGRGDKSAQATPGALERSLPERGLRALAVLLTAVSIVLLFLRFFHLESDFPRHVTQSTSVLTDEGWYSGAAIRDALFGEWRLEGDVNEAAAMPVLHVLERASIAVFGPRLWTLRFTSSLLFSALVILLTVHVNRHAGFIAAALVMVLVSTNFLLFSYSRIALAELPMMFFVVLALERASGLQVGANRGRTIAAGLAAAAAVLCKTSALFSLPVLAAAAWYCGTSKDRRRRLLLFSSFCGLPLLVLSAISRSAFPSDWAAFAGELRSLSIGSSPQLLGSLGRMPGEAFTTGRALFLGAVFAAPAALLSRRVRSVWVALLPLGLLAVSYAGMLGFSPGRPLRYFLPLILLAGAIFGGSVGVLLKHRRWLLGLPLLGVLLLTVSLDIRRVATDMSSPRWTHINFCREAAALMALETVTPFVMGNLGPTCSVVTEIPAASGTFGSLPAADRIRLHRPTHYLSVGKLTGAELGAVEEIGHAELIRSFDVIDWKGEDGPHLYRLVYR